MGINERKEREKEQLRRSILDAAMALFREEGFDQVSVRKIADRIEYSPTTIYLYFRDKNEIFYHLRLEGFQLLMQYHDKYTAACTSDEERFNAYGFAYIDFALAHPHYYQLMFVFMEPFQTHHAQAHAASDPAHMAWGTLVKYVNGAMETGMMPPTDPEVAAYLIHSVVHGLVTLHLFKRTMIGDEQKAKEMIYDAYRYYLLRMCS
jgi:AcrR family transcriptional regulator